MHTYSAYKTKLSYYLACFEFEYYDIRGLDKTDFCFGESLMIVTTQPGADGSTSSVSNPIRNEFSIVDEEEVYVSSLLIFTANIHTHIHTHVNTLINTHIHTHIYTYIHICHHITRRERATHKGFRREVVRSRRICRRCGRISPTP